VQHGRLFVERRKGARRAAHGRGKAQERAAACARSGPCDPHPSIVRKAAQRIEAHAKGCERLDCGTQRGAQSVDAVGRKAAQKRQRDVQLLRQLEARVEPGALERAACGYEGAARPFVERDADEKTAPARFTNRPRRSLPCP
jgi:hypothetical protein